MINLFISCVTTEFGSYREVMRQDFSRPALNASIQEDFYSNGGLTIDKLDEYIASCDAVIHICGNRTGSMANSPSLQYILDTHRDFRNRYPVLKEVFDGSIQLSYTQWEAYLAIYHKKRLFVVSPTENAIRDASATAPAAEVESQKLHLKRLQQLGYYDEIKFNNAVELVKELYRSKFGNIINAGRFNAYQIISKFSTFLKSYWNIISAIIILTLVYYGATVNFPKIQNENLWDADGSIITLIVLLFLLIGFLAITSTHNQYKFHRYFLLSGLIFAITFVGLLFFLYSPFVDNYVVYVRTNCRSFYLRGDILDPDFKGPPHSTDYPMLISGAGCNPSSVWCNVQSIFHKLQGSFCLCVGVLACSLLCYIQVVFCVLKPRESE